MDQQKNEKKQKEEKQGVKEFAEKNAMILLVANIIGYLILLIIIIVWIMTSNKKPASDSTSGTTGTFCSHRENMSPNWRMTNADAGYGSSVDIPGIKRNLNINQMPKESFKNKSHFANIHPYGTSQYNIQDPRPMPGVNGLKQPTTESCAKPWNKMAEEEAAALAALGTTYNNNNNNNSIIEKMSSNSKPITDEELASIMNGN